MDRTTQTSKSAGNDAKAGEPGMSLGPTEAEVDAWAERVRLRRQAWVDGPTEEEKHDWQLRERSRRAARMDFEPESGPGNGGSIRSDRYDDRLRLQRRYAREVRLAAEGLGVMVATLPFRVLADLVVTGQEWEGDLMSPARRRWIPFREDDV